MKQTKSKLKFIFFIAVFILGLFLVNSSASQQEFNALNEVEPKANAAPAQAIARPKLEYLAGGLRDPFKEAIEEGSGSETDSKIINPPALTVQGLIWGARFPQAIINNKVLKVGDTIEGASVISINKDGVAISFEGRQYNLSTSLAEPSKNP